MKLSGKTSTASLLQSLEKKGSEVLQQGTSDDVFPGAVGGIIVDRHNIRETVVWTSGYTDHNRSHAVNKKTLYDLASLTKPLVTVLSLLVLIAKNKLSWDTPLADLLQLSVPVQKKKINLTDLMQHRSGLPAYRPYYHDLLQCGDEQARKKKMVDCILHEPLEYKPGSQALYSDLGFLLLGYAIEILSGESLDVFWQNNVVFPLSLDDKLLFSPHRKKRLDSLIAPTEVCPWTKKMLCGEVHERRLICQSNLV